VTPQEIQPGLLRWTERHPEWTPTAEDGRETDWGPEVGSVLYEVPEATVLFDPQLPSEGRAEFLHWLDERVDARPVSILTTIKWHRRDRQQLAERYRSTTGRAWNAIPPGVTPRPLRGAGETVYWLPGAAALVVGDALVTGPSGQLRVCPEKWLDDVRVDRAGLARLLRALLELPIERVLVSHGEPVLHDGRAALARAISDAGGSSGG
jgi:hypothetical protein